MRFIIAFTTFLICFMSFATAAPLAKVKYEEMTADIYDLSVSLLTALFQSGGEAVEHHNLRTVDYQSFNAESKIGPYHATAHVSYYKDAMCTDLAYTIDDKINRCSPLLGGAMATIVGENKGSWRVKLQAYDSACEQPLPVPPIIRDFKKNTCTEFEGAYITVNMIGQPHKRIPGGGTAFVFYDNVTDCAISKHTNLARATAVFTLPTGVCNNGFLGLDVRAEVCTAEEVVFTLWDSDSDSCDDHYIAGGPVPVDAFACFNIGPIPPVRLLCVGDNGPSRTPSASPSAAPTAFDCSLSYPYDPCNGSGEESSQ
jgi:hypothetical protein